MMREGDYDTRLDEDSPLYNLMCQVVNGERSDWPVGYGEPSHVQYMWDRPAVAREEGGDA